MVQTLQKKEGRKLEIIINEGKERILLFFFCFQDLLLINRIKHLIFHFQRNDETMIDWDIVFLLEIAQIATFQLFYLDKHSLFVRIDVYLVLLTDSFHYLLLLKHHPIIGILSLHLLVFFSEFILELISILPSNFVQEVSDIITRDIQFTNFFCSTKNLYFFIKNYLLLFDQKQRDFVSYFFPSCYFSWFSRFGQLF